VLFAQAVLGDMTLPLAMKALVQILLFPIILIISLIPPWTFAASTSFTAITTTTFATCLCKEQSLQSEPILSRDCSFLLNKVCDDFVWRGGDGGAVVHHELQKDIPFAVPWDSTKEVDHVFRRTNLGMCLCIGMGVGSVSVIGRYPFAEIGILALPIHPRCVLVYISADQ
jgi:hypothetical protein